MDDFGELVTALHRLICVSDEELLLTEEQWDKLLEIAKVLDNSPTLKERRDGQNTSSQINH